MDILLIPLLKINTKKKKKSLISQVQIHSFILFIYNSIFLSVFGSKRKILPKKSLNFYTKISMYFSISIHYCTTSNYLLISAIVVFPCLLLHSCLHLHSRFRFHPHSCLLLSPFPFPSPYLHVCFHFVPPFVPFPHLHSLLLNNVGRIDDRRVG